MKKIDPLAGGALIAALVGTASAEYSLAVACGFDWWFAWCVPAALDLYVVRALKAKRDVAAVVLAMIAVNAVSHLVSAKMLEASVPVVVAVSAIAPLVLWRVHALQDVEEAPTPAQEEPVEELETEPEPLEEELEKTPEGELTLVDQLLMLGEPLPGRKVIMETYGVSEWEARKAKAEALERLEKEEINSP